MTAPHARQPQVLPRLACTPTAIRAVLAVNADSDIRQRYDEDLDAAFEQTREQGDVTPLRLALHGRPLPPGRGHALIGRKRERSVAGIW